MREKSHVFWKWQSILLGDLHWGDVFSDLHALLRQPNFHKEHEQEEVLEHDKSAILT